MGALKFMFDQATQSLVVDFCCLRDGNPGSMPYLTTSFGIEGVPQAIAEQIESQYCQSDEQPRE